MNNLSYQYKRKSGVYRIYSTIDSRCYIGSSKNLYKRINHHLNELRKGTHTNSKLQNFVNKYGLECLEVEVVCLCIQRDLCDVEDEKRKLFDSYHNGFDLLEKSYRPTGFTYTKAQKENLKLIKQKNLDKDLPKLMANLEKARIAYAQAWKEGKIKPTFTGKKHTAETKAKMAEAKKGKPSHRKGKKGSTKSSKAVYCIDEGGYRTDYISAQEAAKITGIQYKTLQQRIKYGRVGKDGSTWFYL